MFSRSLHPIRLLSLALVLFVAALVIVARLAPVNQFPVLGAVTAQLSGWVIVLGACALLLGIFHVAWLHIGRILNGQTEWPLSLLLIVSLLMVLVIGLLNAQGTASPLVEWIFDAIIRPGQASLFALVIFFLAGAGYRLLRVTTPGGRWMLAGAVVVLIVQMPLSAGILPPVIGQLVNWMVDMPVMAAMRGVLLGSGLAAMTIGLRLFVQGRA